MALEIERKFLVDLNKVVLENGLDIKQGYIKTIDNRVVRVRIKGLKAFLTIKSENSGMKRLEFEYEIPVEEANEMLEKVCDRPIIDKTRYEIKHENHLWEVDVFYGDNDGLVIAEVELKDENEEVILPTWVKNEVTQETKYYNNQLMQNPYKNWK